MSQIDASALLAGGVSGVRALIRSNCARAFSLAPYEGMQVNRTAGTWRLLKTRTAARGLFVDWLRREIKRHC